MKDPNRTIAFGCALSDGPEDDELRELVWTGDRAGWKCGRTKAGCWHMNIAARKNSTTAIGAQICMPTERELLRVIEHLEGRSNDQTLEFIESLPSIHAAAQEMRLQQIRNEILRP